jgi:copper chaperone CopZ
MKSISILLATLIALPALAQTPAAPAAPAKTVKLTVDGMVCSFCAQGIEARLKQQAATDKVYVSLDDKLVAVSLKDGQSITDDKLRAELKDAGYEVKAIARSNEPLDSFKKAKK